MYTVTLSFDSNDNIQSKDVKVLDFQQKKAILEKALSIFYKKNVKIIRTK